MKPRTSLAQCRACPPGATGCRYEYGRWQAASQLQGCLSGWREQWEEELGGCALVPEEVKEEG